MGQVLFSASAARQWLKLPRQIRDRIDKKLDAFAATGHGDVKKLKGQPGARLRVGGRVIFYEEGETIVVVAVGHRREIYD